MSTFIHKKYVFKLGRSDFCIPKRLKIIVQSMYTSLSAGFWHSDCHLSRPSNMSLCNGLHRRQLRAASLRQSLPERRHLWSQHRKSAHVPLPGRVHRGPLPPPWVSHRAPGSSTIGLEQRCSWPNLSISPLPGASRPGPAGWEGWTHQTGFRDELSHKHSEEFSKPYDIFLCYWPFFLQLLGSWWCFGKLDVIITFGDANQMFPFKKNFGHLLPASWIPLCQLTHAVIFCYWFRT